MVWKAVIPMDKEEAKYRIERLMNRICFYDCKKSDPSKCDRENKCEDYDLLKFLEKKLK